MELPEAILLGIIQGVTEWLPISSSGHLALAQHLFGTEIEVSFDIILHLGTLLAVIAYYRNDLLKMAKGILARDAGSIRLAALLLISAIPTAIIGLLFRDFFESMFSSLLHVAAALTLTGIFLIFVSDKTRNPQQCVLRTQISRFFQNREPKTRKPETGNSKLKTRDALLIGAAQGLAVAPGISRSGATIGTALLLGIERNEAARFSFLAGILPILGAAVLEGRNAISFDAGVFPLLAGFLSAAIVGYLSIGLLLRVLRQSKLHLFGYYCLLLAAIVVLAVIA